MASRPWACGGSSPGADLAAAGDNRRRWRTVRRSRRALGPAAAGSSLWVAARPATIKLPDTMINRAAGSVV